MISCLTFGCDTGLDATEHPSGRFGQNLIDEGWAWQDFAFAIPQRTECRVDVTSLAMSIEGRSAAAVRTGQDIAGRRGTDRPRRDGCSRNISKALHRDRNRGDPLNT